MAVLRTPDLQDRPISQSKIESFSARLNWKDYTWWAERNTPNTWLVGRMILLAEQTDQLTQSCVCTLACASVAGQFIARGDSAVSGG